MFTIKWKQYNAKWSNLIYGEKWYLYAINSECVRQQIEKNAHPWTWSFLNQVKMASVSPNKDKWVVSTPTHMPTPWWLHIDLKGTYYGTPPRCIPLKMFPYKLWTLWSCPTQRLGSSAGLSCGTKEARPCRSTKGKQSCNVRTDSHELTAGVWPRKICQWFLITVVYRLKHVKHTTV